MQRETNKNMNKEKPVQNRQKKENIQKKQGKAEVCPYSEEMRRLRLSGHDL